MSEMHSDALVFFGATGDLAYKKIFPALQAMIQIRIRRYNGFRRRRNGFRRFLSLAKPGRRRQKNEYDSNRVPGSTAYGLATNREAVSAGRFQYPRANWSPA